MQGARTPRAAPVRWEPGYRARTPTDDVRALQAERRRAQSELGDLMAEWERLEDEVAALEGLGENAI